MSTHYSLGQMNQLGDSLEKAEFTTGDVTELLQYPNLKDFRQVLNWQAKIVPAARMSDEYLRDICRHKVIIIDPTNGTETFFGDDGVLTGTRHENLKSRYFDPPGKATPMMRVTVHELKREAKFAQIYDSLGDLNSLRLGKGQINFFIKKHSDELHDDLSKFHWQTFFLFTRGDEKANADRTNVFVAGLSQNGTGFSFTVHDFLDHHEWDAGTRVRFVVPQLYF